MEKIGNISHVNREFGTTCKTVRKRSGTYREKGLNGLKDRSKALRRRPHRYEPYGSYHPNLKVSGEENLRAKRQIPPF